MLQWLPLSACASGWHTVGRALNLAGMGDEKSDRLNETQGGMDDMDDFVISTNGKWTRYPFWPRLLRPAIVVLFRLGGHTLPTITPPLPETVLAKGDKNSIIHPRFAIFSLSYDIGIGMGRLGAQRVKTWEIPRPLLAVGIHTQVLGGAGPAAALPGRGGSNATNHAVLVAGQLWAGPAPAVVYPSRIDSESPIPPRGFTFRLARFGFPHWSVFDDRTLPSAANPCCSR